MQFIITKHITYLLLFTRENVNCNARLIVAWPHLTSLDIIKLPSLIFPRTIRRHRRRRRLQRSLAHVQRPTYPGYVHHVTNRFNIQLTARAAFAPRGSTLRTPLSLWPFYSHHSKNRPHSWPVGRDGVSGGGGQHFCMSVCLFGAMWCGFGGSLIYGSIMEDKYVPLFLAICVCVCVCVYSCRLDGISSVCVLIRAKFAANTCG